MIVGGGLGAIVTFVVTNMFPVDPQVGFAALFGYFALYGVTAGVLIGAVIALILDRVGLARARSVTVERETIVTPVPEAPVKDATVKDGPQSDTPQSDGPVPDGPAA
jgi:hypothetical protein